MSNKITGKTTTHIVPYGPDNLCDWFGCIKVATNINEGSMFCENHEFAMMSEKTAEYLNNVRDARDLD